MFLELLIAIVVGCLLGVFTGLIPGVHINLVAVFLLTVSSALLAYTNPVVVGVLIVSMSITHTFLDFIPSIFLGGASADTALAVLPGHKLLLKGMGYEAVKLTVIGSLLCLVLMIFLMPLLIVLVPIVFSAVRNYIGLFLAILVTFMILRENTFTKKLWSTNVFLLSGLLGLIVLNTPNVKEPLLPMLSGIFGVSLLLRSIVNKTVLPLQQITEKIKIPKLKILKSVSLATFSGSLVSIFPAIGPAQAAVLASQLVKKLEAHSYLILVGGINTVSMMLALVTMYTIDKARNGSIVVVQRLLDVNIEVVYLLAFGALAAGGIAAFLALTIARIFSKIITKVNYQKTSFGVIVFITMLAFYFSGLFGLIILFTATSIGLIPAIANVPRHNAMGCLILPVIVYFL